LGRLLYVFGFRGMQQHLIAMNTPVASARREASETPTMVNQLEGARKTACPPLVVASPPA